ncbi:hypothetical protein [Haloparvum sedimenti]|uniref:hypothetical protein n=1 Tax=Haloparvum sedimenti TaxID=1678448 RepID=UPI00071E780A|nr:hypothetical protein [Haloparvum sedimenti]
MSRTGTDGGDDDGATEPDERGADSEAVDERVVLANGLTLDKRDEFAARKHAASDSDLRRIALLGPAFWTATSLASLLAVVAGIVFLVSDAATSADVALVLRAALGGDLVRLLSAYPIAVVAGALLVAHLWHYLVSPVRGAVTELGSRVRRAFDHLRQLLLIARWDTLKVGNYWFPFTAHLSDRDPLLVLGRDDIAVTGTYGDRPHYRNVFVDAVYVRFRGGPRRLELEHALFDDRVRRFRAMLLIGLAIPVATESITAALGRPMSPTTTAGVAGVLVLAAAVAPWRVPWREAVPAAVVVGALWLASNAAPLPEFPVLCAAAFLAVLVPLAATRTLGFRSRFYGESAAFSRSDVVLNEPDTGEGRTRLGNSLLGYGVFYVSEYFRELLGPDRRTRVTAGAELADALAADPDDHAAVAAAAGLETAWAGGSFSGEETVDVEVVGVDTLVTTTDPHRGPVGRVVAGLRRLAGEGDDDVTTDLDRTGSSHGIRLPVKAFASVAHSPERLDGSLPEEPIFAGVEWPEERVHHLFLGGAEHNVGLRKLILTLKAAGYENVDLAENAFADPDGIQFPAEYFVSAVVEEDLLSRDDPAFLLFRHPIDGRTAEGDDDAEGEQAHAIVGLSALGSKAGFLFWNDQRRRGFPDLDPDVLYQVTYDDEDIEDLGDPFFDERAAERLRIEVGDAEVLEAPTETRLGRADLSIAFRDDGGGGPDTGSAETGDARRGGERS